MHDIAVGLLHRAHCRLASCHPKRRRFIPPLLARLLVLWKSFVVAWFRQLFCSLPRCRFRKPVGAPKVGSSSLDSVHETRRDRAVSQDSASAALPVPQNSQKAACHTKQKCAPSATGAHLAVAPTLSCRVVLAPLLAPISLHCRAASSRLPFWHPETAILIFVLADTYFSLLLWASQLLRRHCALIFSSSSFKHSLHRRFFNIFT